MLELARTALNAALVHPKMDAMNFLNEVAARHPDAISFAPGRPREEFFAVRAALEHLEPYLQYRQSSDLDALGQYGRTNGIIGDLIAKLLANDQGIQADPDDIVVTVGCQEAMFLCLLTLCSRPDDVALISEPAYIGMSGAARLLGVDIEPVPLREDGIDARELRRTCTALRARGKTPRLLYLSADFANPTGISLPLANRRLLLQITRELELLVVEDDAYGYFHYDGARAQPLKSLPHAEHVIYLGSFSKSLFPSLRVGFLVAGQHARDTAGSSAPLAREMSKVKSLLSVNTSQLNQAIAGGILIANRFSLRDYVEPRRLTLQLLRDTLLAALEQHFPRHEKWCAQVRWRRPSGGFFLSLQLPFAVNEQDLACSIEQHGVIWTPMDMFSIRTQPSREIRLSFSYVTEDQIWRGVQALAAFVRQRQRSTALACQL